MFEAEFLREEEENNPPPESAVLTVLGVLQKEYGMKRGQDIYHFLLTNAQLMSLWNDVGGIPGILFDDDGGEFVSLDDD